MTFNRLFKMKMWKEDNGYNTFAYLYGTHNPDKKNQRKRARARMKQDKFYNGFYDFLEHNKNRWQK